MTLDSLPTEIIRRIAAFLPCQDALAFMRTAHKYHHVIQDRLIFKAMLHPRTLSSMKALPPLPSEGPADELIVELWARLALADQKAWRLIDQYPSPYEIGTFPPPVSDKNPRFMRFIPQLMATHHPIISSLYSTGLYAATSMEMSSSPTPAVLNALDFSLTLLVMQRGMPHVLSLGAIDVDIEIMKLQAILLDRPLFRTGYRSASYSAMFMCTLVEWLRSNRRSTIPLAVWPPSARDIPFTTFMDLPAWFSHNAAVDFQKCHLRTMATPDFLFDGTWASYYSLSIDFSAPMIFQPPVVDVQFSLRDEGEADVELLRVSATGDDSYGTFNAVGFLTPRGEMKMIETNWRGQNWLWSLQMSPIGLFGTWGTMEHVNGFLWMFKEEWCFKPSAATVMASA